MKFPLNIKIQARKWVDLRDEHSGKLYGRYCSATRQVEFAHGRHRTVIDLTQYDCKTVDADKEKC